MPGVALAIETRGLTHRFGSRTAVDDIALQVPAGCICGFLGPNGAGKTTTIRLLLGLLKPTEGTILIDGELASRARPELRRRTGALVESPSLYPNLTGRENLEVIRRLLHADVATIDVVLQLVKLSADADRAVRSYSLGMRQRLGLALALLGEPRLLILDEPGNGLDPAGIRDLRDLLRTLVEQRGITVFLSSHLLAEVELVADRIAILAEGRLLFQGTLAEFQVQRTRLLIIRVDPVAEAIHLLQSHGWTARELPDGAISIPSADAARTADLTALLVNAGLAVSTVSYEQASLESLFLLATEHQSMERAK